MIYLIRQDIVERLGFTQEKHYPLLQVAKLIQELEPLLPNPSPLWKYYQPSPNSCSSYYIVQKKEEWLALLKKIFLTSLILDHNSTDDNSLVANLEEDIITQFPREENSSLFSQIYQEEKKLATYLCQPPLLLVSNYKPILPLKRKLTKGIANLLASPFTFCQYLLHLPKVKGISLFQLLQEFTIKQWSNCLQFSSSELIAKLVQEYLPALQHLVISELLAAQHLAILPLAASLDDLVQQQELQSIYSAIPSYREQELFITITPQAKSKQQAPLWIYGHNLENSTLYQYRCEERATKVNNQNFTTNVTAGYHNHDLLHDCVSHTKNHNYANHKSKHYSTNHKIKNDYARYEAESNCASHVARDDCASNTIRDNHAEYDPKLDYNSQGLIKNYFIPQGLDTAIRERYDADSNYFSGLGNQLAAYQYWGVSLANTKLNWGLLNQQYLWLAFTFSEAKIYSLLDPSWADYDLKTLIKEINYTQQLEYGFFFARDWQSMLRSYQNFWNSKAKK